MENKTKEYNSDITERDKEKLGELARAIRNDRQGDDDRRGDDGGEDEAVFPGEYRRSEEFSAARVL